jgi:hypothetical protein
MFNNDFFYGAMVAFATGLIGIPVVLGLMRGFGLYTIVNEGTAKVYVLFGNVLAVIREPG